jgi:hypothetical protein
MEFQDVKKLFDTTAQIIKSSESARKYSGEDFNIFHILNLTTNEVRLHSNFIGNLLNPIGSHGKGSKLLKLFLNKIQENTTPETFFSENDISKAIVKVEKDIGGIDVNYEEGGRIDIAITQGNSCLVIENKINAGDQYKQLVRYDNFTKQ